MKRKVFFQKSIILYIALLIFLAIMAACVYVIVWFATEVVNYAGAREWIGLGFAIGGLIFLSYTFIRMAKNRIIIEDNEIFVPEHWGSKDHKIQYETHVDYLEIQDIFIISSDKSSLNKSMRWIFTPMPYMVFNCKNGVQKSINVFYYSKKQVSNIIDEATNRARQLGNELQIKTGEEILSEFLSTQKNNS